VFGERVDCETVRGLEASQLTRYERRALKSHVRSCPSCRQKGFGLSSIGFWLRDMWAWLAGGGASAAKLGAVALTAAAVSAPVVTPALISGLGHGSKGGHRLALGAGGPDAVTQLERLVARLPSPLARALSLPAIAPPLQGAMPADVPAAADVSQPTTDPSQQRMEASAPEQPVSPEPTPLDPVPPDPGTPADPPPSDPPPADTFPPDPTPAPADTVPTDPAATPPPDPPPPTP
jgi:hypothetical protein